jgi:polyisoprenoid-binding protein YceI
MRKLLTVFAVAASLAVISPLVAQNAAPELPGLKDVGRVAAGAYQTDPAHSLVGFRVNHFGFNDYFGIFGDVAGTLNIDPANPNAAKVDITVPMAGITTANARLTGHLNAPEFFDSAKFPAARFVSTKVTTDGTKASIEGNLTIRDVTKPVTLAAEFTGAGTNAMSKKQTVGFQATTTIKRSDFGMTIAIPVVSDEVRLDITVAFEKG